MSAANMPVAEVDIPVELVRGLLEEQHPDLAGLDLVELAHGWDNVIYRLGSRYTVRLPRRREAVALIEHEQRCLPALAARLPLPIPAPLRIGRPALGYPWPWSVNPWFDGTIAADATLADPSREARRLGAFLAALHVPAPDDAPSNPHRGQFIGEHTPLFIDRIESLRPVLDDLVDGGAGRALERWDVLVDVTAHVGPPTWLHGDLHAANLLAHDGAISAVIDFGDLCAGDPATDLAIAWMLFDERDRAVMRSAAGLDDGPAGDATWRRGEAWALRSAALYLAHSADNPVMGAIGTRLVRTLLPAA